MAFDQSVKKVGKQPTHGVTKSSNDEGSWLVEKMRLARANATQHPETIHTLRMIEKFTLAESVERIRSLQLAEGDLRKKDILGHDLMVTRASVPTSSLSSRLRIASMVYDRMGESVH
jgi:hypothetical protein